MHVTPTDSTGRDLLTLALTRRGLRSVLGNKKRKADRLAAELAQVNAEITAIKADLDALDEADDHAHDEAS